MAAEGGNFVSRGTTVETDIPRDPSTPITLETRSGPLSLEPLNVNPSATDGTAAPTGAAVVYANTARDTDTLIKPTADGIETYSSIRSSDAPEKESWKVDLKGDETLRATVDGGVQVIDPTPSTSLADAAAKPAQKDVVPGQLSELKREGKVASDVANPDVGAEQSAITAAYRAGVSRPEGVDPSTVPSASPADAASTDDGRSAGDAAAPANATPPASTERAEADAAALVRAADTAGKKEAAQGVEALQAEQVERNAVETEKADTESRDRLNRPLVVAEIHPTWAKDADGKDVPTRLGVAGDTVTMSVDHKGGDYAYPIVADPFVEVQHWYVDWQCCVPHYEWQYRFERWNPQWNYIGHYWTSYLIHHAHHYDWGPSWGWWGWQNVNLGWSWVTMPDWSWGPMYVIDWQPISSWQLVLTGWDWVPVWKHWDSTEWDGHINSADDLSAAGQALATRGDYRQLWDKLPAEDKNELVEASDNYWWSRWMECPRFSGHLSAGSVGAWLEDVQRVRQQGQAALSAGVQA